MKVGFGLVVVGALIVAVAPSIMAQDVKPDAKQGVVKHAAKKAQAAVSAFETADTDKDGKISLAEFTAFRTEQLKKNFAKMDANSDGFLTKEEISKGKAPAWFDGADANKDGKLSVDEFVASRGADLQKEFAKLDGNADGFLTPEEFAAKVQAAHAGKAKAKAEPKAEQPK